MQWQRNFVNERLCQNVKKSRAAVSAEEIEKYVKNLKEILKYLPPCNIINYEKTNLNDEPGNQNMSSSVVSNTLSVSLIVPNLLQVLCLQLMQLEMSCLHMLFTRQNIYGTPGW